MLDLVVLVTPFTSQIIMKLYSYLTGPDDASFCQRVSERLNRGWDLYGPPTLTYDSQTKRVICGQAVVKDVEGVDYSPDVDIKAQ
jgi:hypothetical protein